MYDIYADLTELRVPEAEFGFVVSATDVVFRGRCAWCAVPATVDEV